MVTRYSSKANSAFGGGCSVASLESRELQDKEYTRHLSVDERTKYVALPSQTRKSEWLAGRLAAKYIFLNRLETLQGTQNERWRPTLSKLSSATLDLYPSWMYQKVEVVTTGAKPGLVWCGQARPESISLSHSCGVSCASLSFGAPTAIDIETAVPRLDAFYRINFSDAERRWAISAARDESSRSDWFFTLLWSLKESALKLGCLKQANVWNLPGIEIDGLPGVNDIGSFWFSSTMSSDFAVFTLSVKQHSRVIPVQVAITGTRNLILTVINPLGGVVK
jgi:4'-phosphopantetheinyl transferase superfamily protein